MLDKEFRGQILKAEKSRIARGANLSIREDRVQNR
jgi:hypothetical protein